MLVFWQKFSPHLTDPGKMKAVSYAWVWTSIFKGLVPRGTLLRTSHCNGSVTLGTMKSRKNYLSSPENVHSMSNKVHRSSPPCVTLGKSPSLSGPQHFPVSQGVVRIKMVSCVDTVGPGARYVAKTDRSNSWAQTLPITGDGGLFPSFRYSEHGNPRMLNVYTEKFRRQGGLIVPQHYLYAVKHSLLSFLHLFPFSWSPALCPMATSFVTGIWCDETF